MSMNFQHLVSTFQSTIFTWGFFCDFDKIQTNSFRIKIQLNILNSLLGSADIDTQFLHIIDQYPETRTVLPILLAIRKNISFVLNVNTKTVEDVSHLFDASITLQESDKLQLLDFFTASGLKQLFQQNIVSDLNDYVFGIETGLDTNARKNRSGNLMEVLVKEYIQGFCAATGYHYQDQVTTSRILRNWGIKIASDKANRRFDFAIYTGKDVFLIETNFYGGGGSKLKAVAGEFSYLYNLLAKQNIQLLWITDGAGWHTTLHALEDAYHATEGHIYNLQSLEAGALHDIIT